MGFCVLGVCAGGNFFVFDLFSGNLRHFRAGFCKNDRDYFCALSVSRCVLCGKKRYLYRSGVFLGKYKDLRLRGAPGVAKKVIV